MNYRKILHADFFKFAMRIYKHFILAVDISKETVQITATRFEKLNPILSEHSTASTFHSHISLSCLGHAAPLTTLKATYLQTRYTTAVSSVSVASCRFYFLSDTLTSVLL